MDAVIDRKTGLLAPEGAPAKTTLREVFLAGTAPTEVAPAAGDAAIDTSVQDQYEDVYGDDPQGSAEGEPKEP